MMKIRLLLAGLVAACLTSCASDQITQAKLNQIRPGLTTEADLVQLFGNPDTQLSTYNGTTTLDWIRSEGPPLYGYLPLIGQDIGGMDLDVQQLTVIVAPNRTVRQVRVYNSFGEVQSEAREKIRDLPGQK